MAGQIISQWDEIARQQTKVAGVEGLERVAPALKTTEADQEEYVPLTSITGGDSTWRKLPKMTTAADGSRHACACTPGGSLFYAHKPRAGSVVEIKMLVAREDPNRPIIVFSFPLIGGARGGPTKYSKHRNALRSFQEVHSLCRLLESYAERKGVPSDSMWDDSLHQPGSAGVSPHFRPDQRPRVYQGNPWKGSASRVSRVASLDHHPWRRLEYPEERVFCRKVGFGGLQDGRRSPESALAAHGPLR